ncbi:hypothetical protein GC207_08700 [bacterium]|nr:hypothetical protein [bacterium]
MKDTQPRICPQVILQMLLPLLIILSGCENSRNDSVEKKSQSQQRKEKPISVADLSSSLIPGMTMEETISKLGRPRSEFRENDNIRELDFIRDVGGIPVQGNERVIGFKVRFVSYRLTNWTLIVVDSDTISNRLYSMEPPPSFRKELIVASRIETETKTESKTTNAPANLPSSSRPDLPILEGADVPLAIFEMPAGTTKSRSSVQSKIEQLRPNLTITAAKIYTVGDRKGDVQLAVELDSNELDRFSHFVDQNLGKVVVFTQKGIPVSTVKFEQPMTYYKFDLPLNVR